MEQQIVKPATQTDPSKQSDALFLARLEIEEQQRFVQRLLAGLMGFLLVWLAGLWYFNRPSWIQGWHSAGRIQPVPSKATGSGVEIAQVERLSRELARLQEHLGKALTESLTVKLDTLEERIRMGRAGGLKDLELIQSIKEDIDLLTAKGGAGSSFTASQSLAGADVALVEQFSRLETLVYLSLGTFSVILIAAGGYCFRCSIQLKRLRTDLARFSGQLPLQRRSP